jgi:3-methyladenine DNA glycosylase AlkC
MEIIQVPAKATHVNNADKCQIFCTQKQQTKNEVLIDLNSLYLRQDVTNILHNNKKNTSTSTLQIAQHYYKNTQP